MKIPYRSYPTQPAPGFEKGLIYRPLVPILVIGPTGEIGFEALVDSGSDQTIFPRADALKVGARFDENHLSYIKGRLPSNDEELILGKDIELAMRIGSETYRWPATVWFSDLAKGTPILGHSGFLEYFDVTFFGEKHELEIKPTKNFPGVVTDLWK